MPVARHRRAVYPPVFASLHSVCTSPRQGDGRVGGYVGWQCRSRPSIRSSRPGLARAAVHLRGARGPREGRGRVGQARAQLHAGRGGRRRRRGAAGGRAVGRRPAARRDPAPLVDLALWVADYYGSTPARALELVAPPPTLPARRAAVARRARVARRRAGARRAHRRAARRRRADRLGARRGRRRARPPRGADRQRQDRGLPPGVRGGARARARDDRARAGDRARAADGRALPQRGSATASRSSTPRSATRSGATSATGSRAARRRIVVGARSAVFAPMRGVGLIVVDEEHDTAYKQESDPRYDARTVAAKRAALEGAVAVYGSATPRPESWARLRRLSLRARIGAPMPSVRLVDLRREAGYPLSAPLLGALGGLVDGGGRAILLLNRRGVAPAIHCRACGVSRRCALCDVALTLHRDEALHCHHCGRVEPVPRSCPACGSVELARIGAGTQRLETELAKHLPELERFRLDADVSSRPGAVRDTLERFRAAERAVLVGTQMVAKGHHVPGVALAAVVDADTGLSLPDFRAEERTFQLVTQLAGRSGRDAPGRVARPDVPARRDAAPARRQPRRRRVPRRRARAARGARLPAVPPPRLDPRLRPRAGRAARGAARASGAARGRRRGPARAGAGPPAARAASRAADREDDAAAGGRAARIGAARRRRRRRCAATGSPPSSTSIRSRCRTSAWTRG